MSNTNNSRPASKSKTAPPSYPASNREAWQRALDVKDERAEEYRTAQLYYRQGYGKKASDQEIDALNRAVNTGDMTGLNRTLRRAAEAIRRDLAKRAA